MNRDNVRKVMLDEKEIPRQWYNIVADMPTKPSAYVSPVTHKVAKSEELSAIFPKALIEQEVSQERFIDIPDEVKRTLPCSPTEPAISCKGT